MEEFESKIKRVQEINKFYSLAKKYGFEVDDCGCEGRCEGRCIECNCDD